MNEFPIIKPDADDWDWREIVGFYEAVQSESDFEYAFENYGPLFRRPELRPLEDDAEALEEFMDAHEDARDAWWMKLGYRRYGELYNGHLDAHSAEKERRGAEAQDGAR